MQQVRRVPLPRLQIRVPLERLRIGLAVPALVTVVVIGACWMAFGRRPTSAVRTPAVRESEALRQPARLAPGNSAAGEWRDRATDNAREKR